MIATYRPGASPIHRLPAGAKLAVLALAGTLLVFVSGWFGAAVALAATLALYPVAGLGAGDAWRTLRPLLVVLALLVAAQAWLSGLEAAAASGLRLAALVLLAGLVTMTTPASAMMATMEAMLSPLARLGVDVEKISLALSLALRFIPLVAAVAEDVREAQRARGLDRNLVALAVPVIVRTLKTGEEIADAIDARGFGAQRSEETGR